MAEKHPSGPRPGMREKDCTTCGFDEETIYAMARRQDSLCQFLLGQTLNGDSVIRIDPTHDSWCGRVSEDIRQIKLCEQQTEKLVEGLIRRFWWGAGFVVAMGVITKLIFELWPHMK